MQQKQTALAKQARRELAKLLDEGKDESAKIRVENIIREDLFVEMLEILELYCELLLARFGLLEQMYAQPMNGLTSRKECDPGLEEAVKTIIYAAPRSESKELQEVRNLLIMRFGHPFAQTAIENTDKKVSPRVLSKLGVEPPSSTLVNRYLREIARTYNIEWGDDSDIDDESDGGGGRIAALEPPLEAELSTGDSTRREPIAMAPPSPTSENLHPHIKLPPNTLPTKKPERTEPKPKTTSGGNGSIAEGIPQAPSLDDLMSRFEALKKR
jgi:vacuolar protein sorting-associated protein IST1